MRRKPGTLLPIELDILDAALTLRRRGEDEFHGFGIAQEVAASSERARGLTSHGTLYKALGRLEDAGLLESRWEDPTIAVEERRPPRRLYAVTGAGERAYHAARATTRAASTPARPRLEPS
ncbi:MAG: PadR family transcriptional regulator [Actinobacteria bacterium]|nr:PadR family transcriptional regulator [Actinomycetota bacterium]